MNPWYQNLKKSDLTPPAWMFGPVWALLYSLMALSLFIYLNSKYTKLGLILFGAQLFFNLSWSNVFFKQKLICGALANVILLNILVFLTYLEFKTVSTKAAYLLLPYMIWILLALYLNWYICINN